VCIAYYCNILLLHTSAYYQILLQYYLLHTPTYNCMLLHTTTHYQILLILILLLLQLQLQLQQLLLFQTTNCKQLAASNTTGLCIYDNCLYNTAYYILNVLHSTKWWFIQLQLQLCTHSWIHTYIHTYPPPLPLVYSIHSTACYWAANYFLPFCKNVPLPNTKLN
jgi:hypothetical protein